MIVGVREQVEQVAAQVVSMTELMPGTYLVWLRAPEIARTAQPGQFVMVRCADGYEPLMRRPLSIHRTAGQEQVALLFEVVGRGTSLLSQHQEGDSVDLLGPLGNGFRLEPASQNVLLVAGGMGVAPLVFLADRVLDQGRAAVFLVGASTVSSLYPRSLLPSGVRVVCATDDGSEGREGTVTQCLDNVTGEVDQIFACGPLSMYQSMAGEGWSKHKSIQVSLEAVMGCGLGACYGCTVRTKRGLQQVCRDGPVFDLNDVLW